MRSDSETPGVARAARAAMHSFGWAAVAMLSIVIAPSPGTAAPAPSPVPSPLSPADHQRVRIMNVATQRFLLVAGSAGDRPHTAYTGGGNEGQQFNLELIKLLDMEEEEESVFAVKGSGGRVLKVTEDGAEAVQEPAAWDKSSDATLLFHRRQTTCKNTVALESVSAPGHFLCDAEGGALTLRPVQREEAAHSKCLLEGARGGHQLQERILFRLTALRP